MAKTTDPSLWPGSDFARRYDLKLWIPLIALVIVVFYVTFQFAEPPPPDRLTIATSSPTSEYYKIAQKYRSLLAKEGVELVVKTTQGSVENLTLLADATTEVDLALIQGGVRVPGIMDRLQSLGSLYFEPLWIFYRHDKSLDDLRELKEMRIAVGIEGSGNRQLALELLSANGVVDDSTATLIPLGGADAVEALREGTAEVVFLVTGPGSPFIQEMFDIPEVRLMDLRRSAAYQGQYSFLASVALAEGVLDLQADLPPTTTNLLVPAANMVARKDLHPALIPVLLKVITEVHNRHSIFPEEAYRFPSQQFVHLELNHNARRYIKHGPPFFLRYMSFWTASLLDRLKILILPLLTLLIPLFRLATPTYRWRIRSRIYRWYRIIRDVEERMEDEDDPARIEQAITRLKRVDRELTHVSVPLSYMHELYNLNFHLSFVHDQMEHRLQRLTTSAKESDA